METTSYKFALIKTFITAILLLLAILLAFAPTKYLSPMFWTGVAFMRIVELAEILIKVRDDKI